MARRKLLNDIILLSIYSSPKLLDQARNLYFYHVYWSTEVDHHLIPKITSFEEEFVIYGFHKEHYYIPAFEAMTPDLVKFSAENVLSIFNDEIKQNSLLWVLEIPSGFFQVKYI